MFSRWMAESGVSRGTRISLRASLSMTSAARSIRLSASPAAIAASVPMVQGQTTMASAGLEPDATGANHSSRPKACNWPGCAPKREEKNCAASLARAGRRGPFPGARRFARPGNKAGTRAVRLEQAFEQAHAVGHPRGAGKGKRDGASVHAEPRQQPDAAPTRLYSLRVGDRNGEHGNLKWTIPGAGSGRAAAAEVRCQVLGEIHRAMLAAGAADGHRQIAAIVAHEARQPVLEKSRMSASMLLRVGVGLAGTRSPAASRPVSGRSCGS